VESKEEVKKFMSELLRDKYFQKSTHNTYAYRISQENGSLLESKNDDGETGA
jgi:putative IMPACT (imprinted ancient) family translation regulator